MHPDSRSAMRVLVIEDEIQIARQIVRAMERHGHEASAQHDGVAGLSAALERPPEIIVLDLNLPLLDGYEVLARLKAENCLARIIILTAKSDLSSRITGLKAGADDYLGKPFSMEELVVRVDALGRRAPSPVRKDGIVQVGDLVLNVAHRRVARAGLPLALTPREFELLHVLMQEPNRVFSRPELCERIWQRPHDYDMRTVDILIARLRKKVDTGFPHQLIFTCRALGYTIRPFE